MSEWMRSNDRFAFVRLGEPLADLSRVVGVLNVAEFRIVILPTREHHFTGRLSYFNRFPVQPVILPSASVWELTGCERFDPVRVAQWASRRDPLKDLFEFGLAAREVPVFRSPALHP